LEDLILFSKKLWIRVAIKTNAWLLSDTRLIKIIKYWLDDLYLSIDSSDENIHDYIRWKKWAFHKNLNVIKKVKKINPKINIYVNSVVINSNFKTLPWMIDFWRKNKIDRVSFVFLNDKNRKDIDDLSLTKEEFINFFSNWMIDIYKKAILYWIQVDFSPNLSSLTLKNYDKIIYELENNFDYYKPEIEAFYKWLYWKFFYDKYWCFWPLDHCSINYTGDLYSCCVVERDKENSVWNVFENDLTNLWNSQKYKSSRISSNINCSYALKCASNFNSRKTLFKSIYLDENLYSKNIPLNYYRYLKELSESDLKTINDIKIEKLKKILLHFYNNLDFYRKLLSDNNIKKEDILAIKSVDFVKKLPIIDKNTLKQNYEEIRQLSLWKDILQWKTSGSSGNQFEFLYPLDFKRYIKQIAIFSNESSFTYKDYYFSLTPLNCNQTIINSIKEPNYVKKKYITIADFDFKKETFEYTKEIFKNNPLIKFLHWDSKYILYLVLLFKKFNSDLPKLDAIFLSYSYTNQALKDYIKKCFSCNIFDNYGCSEVGPISADWENWSNFWDNILIYDKNKEIFVTDLDNYYFPFINYRNWDMGKITDNEIKIYWKKEQSINWKSLIDIDRLMYNKFKEIVFYQFAWDIFYYFSELSIDEEKLLKELFWFLWEEFEIQKLPENNFFKIWKCSKFKIVTN
jgi:phenylacetate-CoA ligase